MGIISLQVNSTSASQRLFTKHVRGPFNVNSRNLLAGVLLQPLSELGHFVKERFILLDRVIDLSIPASSLRFAGGGLPVQVAVQFVGEEGQPDGIVA